MQMSVQVFQDGLVQGGHLGYLPRTVASCHSQKYCCISAMYSADQIEFAEYMWLMSDPLSSRTERRGTDCESRKW